MSADNQTREQIAMWEAAFEKGMELHAGCLMAVEMGTSETSKHYKAALSSTASTTAAAILEAKAQTAEQLADYFDKDLKYDSSNRCRSKATQLRGAIPGEKT